MEQKRVPFKIAKAIKEAGYPQVESKNQIYFCKQYNFIKKEYFWELRDGDEIDWEYNQEYNLSSLILAPTYLDVWLWLCRTKRPESSSILIQVTWAFGSWKAFNEGEYIYDDPEEAIIAAIDYLADNNLIK